MITEQYHHVLQCLTFADDRGKVRQAKIAKLKCDFEEIEKPSLKITRIKQISEFFGKTIYLLTGIIAYICNKI